MDSVELIPPAYKAQRAGTTNRVVVVPARHAGNQFLSALKGVQIRALLSISHVWFGLFHRVDRVSSFLSSRPNWVPPSPVSVAPPSFSLQGGRGGPNTDDGTDIVRQMDYSMHRELSRIHRNYCMGPYAGVDYNLTICPLESTPTYLPWATKCQSRL